MSYGMIWYLLSRLDALAAIGVTCLAFGAAVVVVAGIISLSTMEDDPELSNIMKNLRNKAFPFFLVGLLSVTLIPKKKDELVILGLNLAQTPIETVVKDMGPMYPELKELIKQELCDLKKEVTGEKETP